MIEDDYAYFMAAWKYKQAQMKLSQRDLAAKTGSSYQWLNAVYRERVVRNKKAKASPELQKTIAEVLGYGWIEFLQLGKRITLQHLPIEDAKQEEEPKQEEKEARPMPGVEAKHVNPMEVLTAVSVLVDQYQKLDSRMRFWRAIFDELPVSTLIIKNGIVTYQNIKSAAWGNITGSSLCDSCACPEDCKERGDCPSHQAMETRNPTEGFQHIGAGYYKVNIAPVRLHDHEYFLIVAMEAEKHEGEDRRSGVDRRNEG